MFPDQGPSTSAWWRVSDGLFDSVQFGVRPFAFYGWAANQNASPRNASVTEAVPVPDALCPRLGLLTLRPLGAGEWR